MHKETPPHGELQKLAARLFGTCSAQYKAQTGSERVEWEECGYPEMRLPILLLAGKQIPAETRRCDRDDFMQCALPGLRTKEKTTVLLLRKPRQPIAVGSV